MTSEEALSELKEGNRRFTENRPLNARRDLASIKACADDPHPFACVLACADSRVPPEIIFDVGLGDLFTIRVAGNVANVDELASIDYAVWQMHTPLCVVMGHTGCRAVQAVVSGVALPLDIDQLLRQVKTSVTAVAHSHEGISEAELVNAAIRDNICRSVETLRSVLRKPAEQGTVRIVGAEYDVHTGDIVWLD